MTGPRRTPSRTARGSATVPAVACLGLVLVVGVALGEVTGWVVAHRQAQAAADLAALAGAAEAQDGADPCAAAAAVATANGAALARCLADGSEVTVEVEVTGPRWLGQDHDFSAEARAGPGDVFGPDLPG